MCIRDRCILQLGYPGRIRGIMLDTAHFTGNQVPAISIRAANLAPDDLRIAKLVERRTMNFNGGQCQADDVDATSAAALLESEKWETVLSKRPLKPGYEETRRHFFEIGEEHGTGSSGKGWTHLRVDYFPDGGVARLQVFGEVIRPDILMARTARAPIDLAAASNGGVPIACSNKHYGTPANLIAPGRAAKMDEGWETARNPKRPAVLTAQKDGKLELPQEMVDWAIIRLATVGVVEKLEIDTNHFKGNFPESCTVEGLLIEETRILTTSGSRIATSADLARLAMEEHEFDWRPILTRTALKPHTRHHFETKDLEAPTPFSHVKITIFPDGGVSRLRVFGHPVATASSL
eukprot:TRINITY_DN15891_c0_g2_i1.p1 TRINITY_DN15891_c0_g2~~TRINITY_DN15891_c0_g2_i1.p1  ORF type:complete len:349 (-),score=72.49 TRINITY_DN15891_c0_g2_i1:255-1301(-)